MHFFTAITASLTLASGVLAAAGPPYGPYNPGFYDSPAERATSKGRLEIINNCNYPVYVNFVRPGTTSTSRTFPSKSKYSETYKGTENKIYIRRHQSTAQNQPMAVFRYSDYNGELRYRFLTENGSLSFGSPSPYFKLVGQGTCPSTSHYTTGDTVYRCNDKYSVTLTLCKS
ncbi:hypothetical protein NA57DRAFT_79017 [Rhizodiscina lignyota]|uniref:Uncharacterized protein n=1 Tax=Rhizodiscina lignyota TaxID=1504668 RepID=A0A9P4M400_9PEZI|nr:hypothetical protein NA57DRAFT_79017 [Rhizodiscina lignyota]